MKKEQNFFDLFDKFISESQSGKRVKKNGSKLRTGTIKRYQLVRDELLRFSIKEEFTLRIRSIQRLSSREMKSENIYWGRFYRKYSDYLYSLGCFDNYVGSHFKTIRTFFIYLNRKKTIATGDIHKEFYVRSENVPIVVLQQYQLDLLRYNKEFEESLPDYLKRTKDIFVFGSYVGVRFSDLIKLTRKNLMKTPDATYLCVRSVKTGTDTRIKLADYILDILTRYKYLKTLIPVLSNNRLNLTVKELCEKAGWTDEVGKMRECRGIPKKVSKEGKIYRFCDLVSTHTMRRTAVTNLLTLGMSETMVRKLSGHSANSKEFYRYVNYAQQSIDNELDRINALSKNQEKAA